MEFKDRRRQQFLGEAQYRYAVESFERVVHGPEGLVRNLTLPESEPGWHMDLKRGIAWERFNLLLMHYTGGDPIEPMRAELEQVVHAYEQYAPYLWKYLDDRNEPVFKFYSLDEYCQLMQLIGLCFLLHRRDLLPRLAALFDGESGELGGADWLVEELLSYAPMERYETDELCASKPYRALAEALASEDNTSALRDLARFLAHWYKDLAGCGWHDAHKPDPKNGSQAGYYGYWSFEAGAAVILLGIDDDTSLHKYLYYPKDLVAWCRANAALGAPADERGPRLRCLAGQPCPRTGYWFTPAAAGSRQHFDAGQTMPDLGGTDGATGWATVWQWDEQQ
jgi:hypothetical protein